MVCDKCGAEYHLASQVKKNTWKAKQQFKSIDGEPLMQTYPPKPPRTRSATRTRLEQALAVGACLSFPALFISPTFAAGTFLFSTPATFLLSVGLGKENQNALFHLLDRNKDGLVNADDLHDTIDDLRDTVNGLLDRGAIPVHEPPPDIDYTDKKGTRPIPAPEPYLVRSLIIRPETTDQPRLEVEVDTLCAFIRGAVGMGEWTRAYWTSKKRGEHKLSAGTWQAYFHFFSRSDVKLWEIAPPTPDLPGIIVRFRQWATDQPETDRPTVGKRGSR